MLLVKTYLDSSPIHGIGIFADQFIPKGTKVWEITQGFDQIFDESSFARLNDIQLKTIFTYGYREAKLNKIILCCDNARYFNFSSTSNTASMFDDDHSSYALCDILQGEELTYPVDEDLDAKNKLPYEVYQRLKGNT